MASRDDEIVRELQNISFVLSDLNAIRHGEYEPPRGAEKSARNPRATPDDIYSALTNVVSQLERQNIMLYEITKHLTGKDDL